MLQQSEQEDAQWILAGRTDHNKLGQIFSSFIAFRSLPFVATENTIFGNKTRPNICGEWGGVDLSGVVWICRQWGEVDLSGVGWGGSVGSGMGWVCREWGGVGLSAVGWGGSVGSGVRWICREWGGVGLSGVGWVCREWSGVGQPLHCHTRQKRNNNASNSLLYLSSNVLIEVNSSHF